MERHTVILRIDHIGGSFIPFEKGTTDAKIFDYPTRGVALGVAKRYAQRTIKFAYRVLSVKTINTLETLTQLVYLVEDDV